MDEMWVLDEIEKLKLQIERLEGRLARVEGMVVPAELREVKRDGGSGAPGFPSPIYSVQVP